MATETIDINGVHHILFPALEGNSANAENTFNQITLAFNNILPLSSTPVDNKTVAFSDDPFLKFYCYWNLYNYSGNYWLRIRFDSVNDQSSGKTSSSTDLEVPISNSYYRVGSGQSTQACYQERFYLNYIKSKTGKTIAFGFSTNYPSNDMWYVCAMDENNRRGVFSLIGAKYPHNQSTDWRTYVFNGFNSTVSSSTYFKNTLYNLNYISTDQSSTSLVQVPNPWGGAMFKDLYVITSTPLDQIEGIKNGSFISSDGRKFKGVYGGFQTFFNEGWYHSWAIENMAGPFAIEIG